jgi:hypothetical protein
MKKLHSVSYLQKISRKIFVKQIVLNLNRVPVDLALKKIGRGAFAQASITIPLPSSGAKIKL